MQRASADRVASRTPVATPAQQAADRAHQLPSRSAATPAPPLQSRTTTPRHYHPSHYHSKPALPEAGLCPEQARSVSPVSPGAIPGGRAAPNRPRTPWDRASVVTPFRRSGPS